MKRIVLHVLRYWSALPDHPFKLRVIRRATEMLNANMTVSVMGAKLFIRPHEDIGRQVFFEGTYEAKSLGAARNIMSGGGVFVDVGANIGLYSCVLALQSGVRAVAIEPDALNFIRLKENVSLNGLTNVILANVAAWKAPALVELEQSLAANPGSIAIKNRGQTCSAMSGQFTAALPLADILDASGVQSIRLMKIDIEGLEIDVLEPFFESSKWRPSYIICELNQWGADSRSSKNEDLSRMLCRFGYVNVNDFDCNVLFERVA